MPTPAPIYRMLAWAIENRAPLSCVYNRQARDICPIILGRNRAGDEVLLAYQFGGESSGGAVSRPNWKCFRVAKLRRVEIAEGEWQAGTSHSERQTCVRDVDYDVNETSPYEPRRSLGSLRGESGAPASTLEKENPAREDLPATQRPR